MITKLNVKKVETPTIGSTKETLLQKAYEIVKGEPTLTVELLMEEVPELTDYEWYACEKLARDSEINFQIIKENGGFTKIVNKMIDLAQKDIIKDGYTEEYILML